MKKGLPLVILLTCGSPYIFCLTEILHKISAGDDAHVVPCIDETSRKMMQTRADGGIRPYVFA